MASTSSSLDCVQTIVHSLFRRAETLEEKGRHSRNSKELRECGDSFYHVLSLNGGNVWMELGCRTIKEEIHLNHLDSVVSSFFGPHQHRATEVIQVIRSPCSQSESPSPGCLLLFFVLFGLYLQTPAPNEKKKEWPWSQS